MDGDKSLSFIEVPTDDVICSTKTNQIRHGGSSKVIKNTNCIQRDTAMEQCIENHSGNDVENDDDDDEDINENGQGNDVSFIHSINEVTSCL